MGQIYLRYLDDPQGLLIYLLLNFARKHKLYNSSDHFQLTSDKTVDLSRAVLLPELPHTIHLYSKILDPHQKLRPEKGVFYGTQLALDDI